MNITGIVAEYNPFHNGHKYMIEQACLNGATHVVAVMSGAAVQRGDVAVFDKHFRARKAVESGVDLVLELPFPYSCSSGEIFAKSALSILAGLGEGVVNSLAFGCECDDVGLLKKAAKASTELSDNDLVRSELANGKSYPAAVYEAASKIYGIEVGEILRSPNNILAVEYIKAAGDLKLIPIKRKGVEHDSNEITDDLASASAIRNMIHNGDDISDLCPYDLDSLPIYSMKKMEREILFRLSCMEKTELTDLPDCSNEIADKILAVLSYCPRTLDELLNKCKSKNITMARLRRIIMYAVLGVKKSDFVSPPYARILAFNSRGAEVLAKCRNSVLPIDTSLKALENSSENARRIVHLENNAVSFQDACVIGEYAPENEYRRKIQIIK